MGLFRSVEAEKERFAILAVSHIAPGFSLALYFTGAGAGDWGTAAEAQQGVKQSQCVQAKQQTEMLRKELQSVIGEDFIEVVHQCSIQYVIFLWILSGKAAGTSIWRCFT